MQPKVLVITDAATTRAGWILTALRLLGFDAQCAYTRTSGSQILLTLPDAEYRLDIDDANLRTRLRQYNAVLVMPLFDNYSGSNPAIAYTLRFLGWNDPQDPAFAYFGLHFATNRTAVPLPSDFPLVRPDRANLASTAHKIGPEVAQTQTQTLRVRLTRETAECYLPIITDYESGDGYYVWRLDATKHGALGSAGEVLAEVIGEDYVFDTTPICAYRYRNCYLMPRVFPLWPPAGATTTPQQSFWLLYALKCIGLQPRYKLPVMMMLDDVQDIGVDTAPRFTGAPYVDDWLRSRLYTYQWYATEFFTRTEIPLWAAITTGGRYNSASAPYVRQGAWNLFMRGRRATTTNLDGTDDEPLSSDGVQLAQQMLQLFQREQNRSMRFCFHDHRTMFRQVRTATRHADTGYPLAAPNDVPVAHGQIVRQGHIAPPPNAVEIAIDGEAYYDINPQRTGASETFAYNPNSLHAVRILVERNRAEMRALGFADGGIGGDGRFHIAAGGHYGSPAVAQALGELGVRIFRTNFPAASFENTQTRLFAPIRGVWLYGSATIDGHGASPWLNGYGLYDAVNPTRSYVGSLSSARDPNGDISSIWTTDPVRARLRAYRRLMGYLTDAYLMAAVYPYQMAFHHPPTLLGWCDPADPLRRFDAEASVPSESPGPYINMLLEFWLNFEVVYRVLSDYLTPATGENVVATRERWVMGG